MFILFFKNKIVKLKKKKLIFNYQIYGVLDCTKLLFTKIMSL